MSSIYERALYPSQRSVKWLHQTLSTLKWNIIVKGYTPDEAEEMVWDLLEEADLRRTENVLGIEDGLETCICAKTTTGLYSLS